MFCVDVRQPPLITALFLDLENAEDVRGWVDDPGGPGEADVGHAVRVCWSAVPTVLSVTSRWVPLPHLNTVAFSLSICSPSLPW
jgi:hypothetical protein